MPPVPPKNVVSIGCDTVSEVLAAEEARLIGPPVMMPAAKSTVPMINGTESTRLKVEPVKAAPARVCTLLPGSFSATPVAPAARRLGTVSEAPTF